MSLWYNRDGSVASTPPDDWGGRDPHALKTNVDGYHVSTVYLALDHSYTGGIPVIFETMVFGAGRWQEYCERYHTEEEAAAGHAAVVAAIKAGKTPDEFRQDTP